MFSKKPEDATPDLAEELRLLRENASEVDRICRETQDAIIKRAMFRIIRPMGGGE